MSGLYRHPEESIDTVADTFPTGSWTAVQERNSPHSPVAIFSTLSRGLKQVTPLLGLQSL